MIDIHNYDDTNSCAWLYAPLLLAQRQNLAKFTNKMTQIMVYIKQLQQLSIQCYTYM